MKIHYVVLLCKKINTSQVFAAADACPTGRPCCKIKVCLTLAKEEFKVDLLALLQEKKKKANENNKPFPKAGKVKTSNNKMPMRKSGRGK